MLQRVKAPTFARKAVKGATHLISRPVGLAHGCQLPRCLEGELVAVHVNLMERALALACFAPG
eukprot:4745985-Pleurochrysis_carterae.AAC.3